MGTKDVPKCRPKAGSEPPTLQDFFSNDNGRVLMKVICGRGEVR
jgi:hypothetical protein